jgi:subtilisin family serine protease
MHTRLRGPVITGILALLAVLAANVLASETEPNDCNCNNTAVLENKLVDSQEILRGFEQGQEKVKVIVNLAESPEIRSKVRWKSKASLQELHGKIKAVQLPVLSALSKKEFKLRHRFENQAGFSGEVSLDALEKLIDNPSVLSIEPVLVLEPHLAQGIPLIGANTYRSTYNGQGVAIAICDTVIDYTHSKLGNGGFPNSKVIGGYDFGDNDSDPKPIDQAHGTCCAGIAAGNAGNVGDYIGGVAYNAKLYALKITAGSSGGASSDDMVAAWDWCITHMNDDPANPILVISTSFGGGRHLSICDGEVSAMTTAANNAVAAGITVLASSGNDGFCNAMAWPACISSVISVGAVYDADIGRYPKSGYVGCISSYSCVGYTGGCPCPEKCYVDATTAADQVTTYSNTASFLDILAPSNKAYTLDIAGSGGYSTNDYYAEFGGTSAACPYAAGAVACLQSAAKDRTGSYMTPEDVRMFLASSDDLITDSKAGIIKPRINLAQAIDGITSGCSTATIGSSTSSWDYPMYTLRHDSRTQVIYLASEIGSAGLISSLRLYVTFVPSQVLTNWTIRMKHTTLSRYSTYSFDSTGWTTVYQANESIVDTGWPIFNFSTPFNYNGTDNLMIDFSFNNTYRTLNNGRCRYSTPGANRSIYAYSNSYFGDPLDWSQSYSPATYYSGNVPNVRLAICQPQEPNAPFLHAEPNVTEGLCNTIYWDFVFDANDYFAEYSGTSDFSVVDGNSGWINDANYQFCGLVSGQTYFYRVKARSQFLLEGEWSNIESSRQCSIPGDFEPDCDVDWADLKVLAEQWLGTPGTPSADIAPPPSGDGIVNFLDFAELAKSWMSQ